jgi:hypothetical protein
MPMAMVLLMLKDTTKATANANEWQSYRERRLIYTIGEQMHRYFYHPDHLGSSSYITDASGEVYQHFEFDEGESPTQNKQTQSWQYFPFGELEHSGNRQCHKKINNSLANFL